MKPNPRNVVLDIVLTVVFCGLWNLLVQFEQIKALNYLLGTEKYTAWKVYLLCIVTCGLYLIYFEYQKAQDVKALRNDTESSDEVLAVILTILGFHWVWDAFTQTKLNELLKVSA